MSEASFASLGPTLLARKGGAKPAMRPQLAPLPEVVEAEQLEDLGWNDMGGDDAATEGQESAEIVALDPAQRSTANEDFQIESPLVKQQQEKLEERVSAKADAVPELIKTKPVKKAKKAAAKKVAAKKTASKKSPAKSAGKKTRRAAFTLRLDTDRHLKLRLAATMQGVSAQALVTQALDAMLSDIDDLDTLAEQLSGRLKHN